VFARICTWVDDRTGYRRLRDAMLLEHIPGGARWRYVWGSVLAFVFLVQLVTGVLLMTAYSPGSSTAWGSVYFIQYQMDFGWLIRGLHHFGSQTMVVLLGIHMLQVVIAGAQLPPREFNWWLGMGLLGIVLGLSLTGYLLPWDQRGYWATQVATNIAGNLPGVGTELQKVIVGGPAYGNSTLTHFYALHVGILPPLLIVLLIAHVAIFRRHGITAPANAEGEGIFWPEQAFRDLVVCLAVFGVMLFLVFQGHGHPIETSAAAKGETGFYEQWAHAGREGLGANLDAPADPSQPYPARPEWYFLFLFQLLKYFEGSQEIIGTVVIPNGAALLLFILPLLGFGRMRRFGHVVGVLVMVGLLAGAAALTLQALADDSVHPLSRAVLSRLATWVVPAIAGFFLLYLAILAVLPRGGFRRIIHGLGVLLLVAALGGTGFLTFAALNHDVPAQVGEVVEKSMKESERQVPAGVKTFHQQLEQAERKAGRAVHLAAAGIPADGAMYLLRNDPKTQFKRVFLTHCASCHSYGEFGPAAFKTTAQQGFEKAKFVASDLAGFGSEDWIFHFLQEPGAKRFLGRSLKGGQPRFSRMADWVESKQEEYKGKEAELKEGFRQVAAWLATHPTRPPDKGDEHAAGYQLFTQKFKCINCHRFGDQEGKANVPVLTGYGAPEWLRMMIRSPGHPRLYGKNNAMPAFRDLESPTAELQKQDYAELLKKGVKDIRFADLSNIDREIAVRYLTGDYRVIFGGQSITGITRE
jgi:quinol-cytochrome oxidoreductase complex cytochrome b subunit/mono/diheme cytochrome c family protein